MSSSTQVSFFSGDFTSIVNDKTLLENPSDQIYYYRSMLALNDCQQVLQMLGNSRQPLHQLLIALARQQINPKQAGMPLPAILAAVEATKDAPAAIFHHALVLATLILLVQAPWDDHILEPVFHLVTRHKGNLECHAWIIYIYLRLYRYDMAEKELNKMKSLGGDDDILVQLVEAWIHVVTGKAKDALFVYQDMADTLHSTCLLSLNQAVCSLVMSKPEAADRMLQEALAKKPNDADTLGNVLALSFIQNKNSDEQRKQFLAQAWHPWVKCYEHRSMLFDQSAAKFFK